MNEPAQRLITRRDIVIGTLAVLSTLPACAQVPTATSANEPLAAKKIPVFKNDAAKARYLTAYDAVLRDWPVPYQSLFLSTRYGSTHVIASGPEHAPPLILLPALLATGSSWRPNVGALTQHFRCYAVDVIGEINKSEPTRLLKNKQDCAEWLTDVLDALHIEKASFVGASLGGFFALNQGVLKPDRVERLVLISPAAGVPMAMGKFMYYVGLAMIGFERPLDEWMGGGIPWNPADNSSGALWAANSEGRGTIRMNNMNLGESISDAEWRSVRARTLLLIGDREVIYKDPPEEALKLALERVPGLNGEIVPKANHLAARANPTFVNERITRFLRSE